MNSLKKLALFVVSISSLFACNKNDQTMDQQRPDRIYTLQKEELNIAYGGDALQKMDIYFPDGFNTSTPVAFVIHGGGFVAGTKEDFSKQAKMFMSKGFVTVNISHRLVDVTGLDQNPPVHKASSVKISDEVDDIAAAVEKYKSVAAGFGSGTGKMYMAGHSAGGTLAMLYVQGAKNLNKQVRASGNLAGLTNLTLTDEIYNNPPQHEYWPALKELIYRLAGAEVVKENALYLMAISPNWVSTSNKPGMPNITVMPKSNDDDLHFAPYYSTVNDARNYDEELKSRGVRSEFILMDTDHGFGNHPDDWGKAIKYTTDFFRKI